MFIINFVYLPSVRYRVGKGLFQSVGCPFVLLIVSFPFLKLCNFRTCHLLIVDIRAWAIGVLFRKLSPVQMVQVFFPLSLSWHLVYPVLCWGPWSISIVGSLASTNSNFLDYLLDWFSDICNGLQKHQVWRSVPFTSQPCQRVLSTGFLILAILIRVTDSQGYFDYITLTSDGCVHFSKFFLGILDSSVENSLLPLDPRF